VTSNPIERQQNTNWKSQIVTSNLDNNHGSDILKSQIAISRWGGIRKLPYAFTRNGVAMLSSVLRSQTAVGVNVKIVKDIGTGLYAVTKLTTSPETILDMVK